jgi:hypothetical protein
MFSRITRRSLAAAVAALGVVASVAVPAAANQDLTLSVTDRGVEAHPDLNAPLVRVVIDGREPRDNPPELFERGRDRIARILVRMPGDREFQMTDEQLRGVYARDLERAVRELRDGPQRHSRFDIQLLENITLPGYANDARQKLGDRFGRIAYGALVRTVEGLERDRNRVSVFANLGSEGTKIFARLGDTLRPIAQNVRQITLETGRAKVPDVERTLNWLEPWKLRLIVHNWDVPGPGDSISRLDAAERIATDHPGVQLLLVHRHDGFNWNEHDGILSDGKSWFDVRQKMPNGKYELVGTYKRDQLMPFLDGKDLHDNQGRLAERWPTIFRPQPQPSGWPAGGVNPAKPDQPAPHHGCRPGDQACPPPQARNRNDCLPGVPGCPGRGGPPGGGGAAAARPSARPGGVELDIRPDSSGALPGSFARDILSRPATNLKAGNQ